MRCGAQADRPTRSALRPCHPRGSGVPPAGVSPGAGLGSGEDEERSAPMTDRAIRASDKERESVVDVLRDAYTDGRLTLEEFEERTSTDRKSTRLNSSHPSISYAVFCLKKKKNIKYHINNIKYIL